MYCRLEFKHTKKYEIQYYNSNGFRHVRWAADVVRIGAVADATRRGPLPHRRSEDDLGSRPCHARLNCSDVGTLLTFRHFYREASRREGHHQHNHKCGEK